MIKRPYTLVNRAICPGCSPIPIWQLIEPGESVICKTPTKVTVYSVELIDLDNGIIDLKNIKTEEKYSLTSNHDSRNFNVYWKLDNEFERKPKNV